MQEEIQRLEIRKRISLDVARDDPAKVRPHALARDVFLQEWIPLRLQGDQSDIGGVTLVTRPCMSDGDELDAHQATSTLVCTTLLSISAGQYATISSTFGRPPAKPVTVGGPLRTSGASSRVKRSTAGRSGDRTPTRSCTSGTSCAVPASGPCVADAPTNSVSNCSNRRPRRSSRARMPS